MKYILSFLSMCVISFGLVASTATEVEAGSRRNAAIAGAIIGGAIIGGTVARHHRRHRRSYYDDDDGYEYERPRYRRCYRERRCRLRPAYSYWRHGRRHHRPARERCRRVRVCR